MNADFLFLIWAGIGGDLGRKHLLLDGDWVVLGKVDSSLRSEWQASDQTAPVSRGLRWDRLKSRWAEADPGSCHLDRL